MTTAPWLPGLPRYERAPRSDHMAIGGDTVVDLWQPQEGAGRERRARTRAGAGNGAGGQFDTAEQARKVTL